MKLFTPPTIVLDFRSFKVKPHWCLARINFLAILAITLLSAPLVSQTINTIAGDGLTGSSGNGGFATAARVNNPTGLCRDAQGNIFIADLANHCVRKISTTGIITLVAGSFQGFSGDGGPATSARLSWPYSVDVDLAGNLYIADGGNNRIRKVDASGIITTIAGTGVNTSTGDGGPATLATLNVPCGVHFDPMSGDLYITEFQGNCVRKINSLGVISRVAGTGAMGSGGDGGPAISAQLSQPWCSVYNNLHRVLFISENAGSRIRKIDMMSGIITTHVVGTISGPRCIAGDPNGDLYIASQNNSTIYKKIYPSGALIVVAGTGITGYSGDGGPPTSANLNNAMGICTGAGGGFYIADTWNHRIRSVMPVFSSLTTTVNVSCFGSCNGSANVYPSGGVAPYTYSWSPSGGTAPTASSLCAGTYTCTITDASAATITRTFNITAPSAIVVTPASQTNVSCFGGSNGAASINTPTGGAGGYTYNWTPGNPTGDGTTSVTGLAAGNWTCTVTDANSCTVTQTFNITSPSALTVAVASQTNIACYGNSNGAASVSVSGGTTAYSYNWTPGNPTGDGTASVTGLTAGTWTCTVTDANSCVAAATFNITEPPAIVVTSASQTNVSCFAGSNGTASVNNATGGTPVSAINNVRASNNYSSVNSVSTANFSGGFTYEAWLKPSATWTTGDGMAFAINTTGGTGNRFFIGYHAAFQQFVYFDDNLGNQYFTGTQPRGNWYHISVTITNGNVVSLYLNGVLNRTVTTNATALAIVPTDIVSMGQEFDAGPVTSQYFDGFIDEVRIFRTVLASGQISTDFAACPFITSSHPNWSNIVAYYKCDEGSGTLVTDASGNGRNGTRVTGTGWCTPAQVNYACFASSPGGFTYDWTPGNPTGDGTTSVSGLTAGTWTCIVTDISGCTATQTFNITQPAAITFGTFQGNVNCFGGSNGFAVITVNGGTGPTYTYDWTPGNPVGDGGQSVTGLTAGGYTVTVTDANSCTATQTFNITSPSALVATAASQTNISCNGGSNGAASINTPTGGAGGYTYNWTPGNPTGDGTTSVTGLTAGTWTCTVTDANSCTTTQTFNITSPSALVATAASQTNISCNGGSNGAASINTPTGGAGGYTYNWTPGNPTGDGTVSVTGLTAGTWTCTVTDANSCTTTQTFNITAPSVINVTAASATYVSCFGGSNGAASINTPTGGAGGYTYNWTPGNPTGDGTTSVTGLTAGTWTCTVTDANSCTATQTFNITEPIQVVASAVSQTDILCNGASTGAATVSASGGTASYTYSWTPSGGTTATATGLTAGTYTATVSDGNGCTATQTFNITQPAALSATTMQTNVSCNAGSNGDAMVMVSGGTGSYTYSWAPSGGTNATATGLTAGTYTCTATDANGCTITNTFNITSPSALVAGASSQTNVSCNAGTNGAATVGAAGGAGSYTYSWSPTGGTAATATGLAAGVYTVTVTDANSCTATQTFNITEPSALSATTMQTNVSCNAGSNGDAMVMVSGGTGSYTYSWAPSGGTAATATGLTAGTYTCTTTDANGCTLTSTVSITEPSALTAASSASTVLCNGDTSTVTVTASGGVSPYAGAGTFNQIAGTYTYTLTDNNGCTTTTSVTITEPTAIATAVTSTNVLCNGDSTGSIDLTVTGGTAPYTFNWNSGAFTTEDLTNIPAGSYTGILTDANGCTDGGTVVISEPAVLIATAVVTNPTGCTTNNGSIDLSVTGGTPGYAYMWSTTAMTEDVTTLDGGNYTVTVTDTNGCSVVESFMLTEPGAPTVTFSAGLDTVCQSTATPFTLTGASPAGGVFTGTGMINDTVFDPMTASLGFNVITYTYTDSLGCTGSAVDSILVDICTDLASQVAGLTSQVSIFPNPNNGAFTLITTTNADMMIYDAQGKLVAAQKVHANVQNQINIESSGMYLITIVAADGSRTTQRVVVTK